MAKLQRCAVVHGNGNCSVANGTSRDTFDLDEALQNGAKIVAIHPIGTGTSILLVIEFDDESK